MSIDLKAKKKERILDILSGEIKQDSPKIDRSELGKLVKSSAPKFPPSNFVLIVPPLAGSISVLAYALFVPSGANTQEAAVIPVLAIASIFLWVWRCMLVRRNAIKQFNESLSKPLDELQHLHDYLFRYLRDLDSRTSRYFHCVTNTKVSNYFILTQIGNAMNERLTEVKSLIESISGAASQHAFMKLQGNLVFQDGAIKNQGNTHVVPLARLSEAVPALIQNLESGISELESELKSTESRISAEAQNQSEH